MNAFDRIAMAERQEAAVSVWVSFVAAVQELLHSYHSAQITQRTERTIVVRGRAMHSPDDIFRIRTVVVTAEFIEGELVIRCLIQRWSEAPKGHPLTIDNETPIDLRIQGAQLLYGNALLTPFQAAERVLLEAFRG